MPTRNITCWMSPSQVRCDIAALNRSPAPDPACQGTVGYRAILTADGVSQPCVAPTDQPTPAGPGVPALDYGQSKTVGPYTCTSTPTGIVCKEDASGRGFTLAKAGFKPAG
jgi:hypothetical protein